MMVKKAVYYLLAAGPILLLGMIAINSRLNYSNWEFVEYGPETSSRLMAFAEPVSAVRTYLGPRTRSTEEDVRRAASAWLQGYADGTLKDVPPASTLNFATSPVYQQVLDAKMTLMEHMLRTGDQLRARGDKRGAAFLYLAMVEVGDVAKFSEFASVADASAIQSDGIKRLVTVADALSETDRAAVLTRLSALDTDSNRSLVHVADRLAAAYQGDLRRQHRPQVDLVAARDAGTLASADNELQSKISEWEQLSRLDDSLVPLYGRSRVAYIHLTRFEKMLASLREALKPTVSSS